MEKIKGADSSSLVLCKSTLIKHVKQINYISWLVVRMRYSASYAVWKATWFSTDINDDESDEDIDVNDSNLVNKSDFSDDDSNQEY